MTGGGNAGIKLTTTVGPIALAAAGRASGFSLEADDNDNHLTFALLKKTGNAATRAQLKMEATAPPPTISQRQGYQRRRVLLEPPARVRFRYRPDRRRHSHHERAR